MTAQKTLPTEMVAGGRSYGRQMSELEIFTHLNIIVDDHINKLLWELKPGQPTPEVLDLGAGHGDRAVKFARKGVLVTAVDFPDHSDKFDEHNRLLQQQGRPPITFLGKDVRDLTEEDLAGHAWGVINIQNCLHFLPFDDARSLLTLIRKTSPPGAMLALSFGTDTHIPPSNQAPVYEHPLQDMIQLLKELGFKRHAGASGRPRI